MDVEFLESVMQKSIELCGQYVDLLETLRRKCRDQDNNFIVEQCKTLRSSEKLIILNRSIIEEIVSVAGKSVNTSNEDAGESIECDNLEHVDVLGSQASGVDEEVAEEKYRPRNNRTPFYVEKFVNLAEQRVSFQEAVTVVRFSDDMDETPPTNKRSSGSSTGTKGSGAKKNSSAGASTSTEEDVEEKYRINHRTPFYVEKFVNLAEQRVSFKEAVTVVHFLNEMPADEPSSELSPEEHSSVPAADESSSEEPSSKPSESEENQNATKKRGPNKNRSLLLPAYVQKIRDGKLDFTRNINRTIGLCFFCDERKSFTKFQWQKHLLSHTRENLNTCKQCGSTTRKQRNHKKCSPDQMTNIYDYNHCAGDDYLAAFVCNECHYVQVDENRMVEHLKTKHNVNDDYEQSYKKCNFVTNV